MQFILRSRERLLKSFVQGSGFGIEESARLGEAMQKKDTERARLGEGGHGVVKDKGENISTALAHT